MAQERFFQRLRSGESPKDTGRVARTGIPMYHKRQTELEEAAEIPTGLERRTSLTDAEKAAITRQFMNTPVYPSRLRAKGLQAKRGGKTMPHPMRSAE